MNQIRWIERKFNFDSNENLFPSIIERLEGTPIRLKDKLSKIETSKLNIRHNGKWSIIENIGHLLDLEPLGVMRLEEILRGNKELTSADMENKMTEKLNYNNLNVHEVLKDFSIKREELVMRLNKLTEEQIFKYSFHSRLKKTMRIMDLFLFIAEHDDHHLARISKINNALK